MLSDLFVHFPLKRLESDTEILHRLGIAPEVALSVDEVLSMSAGRAKKLGQLLATLPAHTLHAPFWGLDTTASPRRLEDFAILARTCDLAREWGSRLVVLHPHNTPWPSGARQKKALTQSAAFFHDLLAPRPEVLAVIENIFDPGPGIVLQLLKTIDLPNLGPCLDVGHLHMAGQVPLAEWLRALPSQPIRHFHLHDNDGHDDQHLPLGQGSIDWRQLRQLLEESSGPYSVTLEPHSQTHLEQSLAYYRQHFLNTLT